MNPWKSDYILANKLNLHYTRTGGDMQSLVLMHGVTDDGLCWTRMAEALEAEYDVIMLDARGHGRSDAPKRGYGPDFQAQDLAGVIRELKLQRPIILGHSMGAATALTFAGTYPDLPYAILLEDPPHWWMQVKEVPEEGARRADAAAWMEGLKRKTRSDLIAEQGASMPHWPKAEIERWADSKHRFSLNAGEVFKAGIDRDIDWKSLLPHVVCPALLITADPAHGAIVTAESAAALQALIPRLKIENVPAAGHSIRHDQFDAYMKIVRGFLDGIKE